MENNSIMPMKVKYIGKSNASFTNGCSYDVIVIYSTNDYLVRDDSGIKTVMGRDSAELITPEFKYPRRTFYPVEFIMWHTEMKEYQIENAFKIWERGI